MSAAPLRVTAADVAGKLSWTQVVDGIANGHTLPKAQLQDTLLRRGSDALLSRAAWIDGLGLGVKSATVMPANATRGLPSVHGAMVVFDDVDGRLRAMIDNDVVTNWKTAADSALGARILARPESARLLIIGAGVVAGNIARAYCETLADLQEVRIWNRTPERAVALAQTLQGEGLPAAAVDGALAEAVGAADVIVTATMSSEPVLHGDWVSPGAHVDLIGAFTPDMREADDALLRRGRVFVDSLDTTLDHIGELKDPLARGVIARDDVRADFYGLVADAPGRRAADEITVFKNGGGAHLDLMTASVILDAIA